uniref:Uncharacterized protein n=1 Tax=Sphaerodactylus townsendi TaxID=933632 RepID=A0ACB8EYQ3_9SAUR
MAGLASSCQSLIKHGLQLGREGDAVPLSVSHHVGWRSLWGPINSSWKDHITPGIFIPLLHTRRDLFPCCLTQAYGGGKKDGLPAATGAGPHLHIHKGQDVPRPTRVGNMPDPDPTACAVHL